MEEKIINYIKALDIRIKVIFISAVAWALIAHGTAFFHVTSFHDDAKNLFAVGSKYELGRWALALTADFINLYEVVDMPHHPDYGSIKVINETVIVKF